jgi:uncharacterized protein YjbI with pentapeptide repeats
MQTRRILPRLTLFSISTVKIPLLLLAVAGMLLGAGSTYAGQSVNGTSFNGTNLNGVSLNGLQHRRQPTQRVRSENLPWDTLSHTRFGKSANSYRR